MHSSFSTYAFIATCLFTTVFISLPWLLAACKTDLKIHDCTAVTKQIRWSKKQIILTFYGFFFFVVKSHNNSAAHFVPVRLFYVPPTLPQKKIILPLQRYYIKNTKRDSCTGEKNKDFLLWKANILFFLIKSSLNRTWKFTLLSMFVSDHLSWTNALYHWRWLLTYSSQAKQIGHCVPPDVLNCEHASEIFLQEKPSILKFCSLERREKLIPRDTPSGKTGTSEKSSRFMKKPNQLCFS